MKLRDPNKSTPGQLRQKHFDARQRRDRRNRQDEDWIRRGFLRIDPDGTTHVLPYVSNATEHSALIDVSQLQKDFLDKLMDFNPIYVGGGLIVTAFVVSLIVQYFLTN